MAFNIPDGQSTGNVIALVAFVLVAILLFCLFTGRTDGWFV